MGGQYFPVTVLGGRPYVDGFSVHGQWDAKRLPYQDETTVEILVTRAGHRRVRTAEELHEVLRESEKCLPAIRVWISKGLEEFVHGLWKEQKVGLED